MIVFYMHLSRCQNGLVAVYRAVVDEFRGRTRGVVPSSFQELAGGEKGAGEFDLSQYGVDLSFMARQGLLPPVIGREDEIDRIIQVWW